MTIIEIIKRSFFKPEPDLRIVIEHYESIKTVEISCNKNVETIEIAAILKKLSDRVMERHLNE